MDELFRLRKKSTDCLGELLEKNRLEKTTDEASLREGNMNKNRRDELFLLEKKNDKLFGLENPKNKTWRRQRNLKKTKKLEEDNFVFFSINGFLGLFKRLTGYCFISFIFLSNGLDTFNPFNGTR